MNEQLLETYREEVTELLDKLEGELLEIERGVVDPELINAVFRCMHTIKGSSGMFGFAQVSRLAHELETVLAEFRESKAMPGKEVTDLILRASDLIRAATGAGEEGLAAELEELAAAVPLLSARRAAEGPVAAAADATTAGPGGRPGAGEARTYRVRFEPRPDYFATGGNPLLVLLELAGLGKLTLSAELAALPPLAELDPEACYAAFECLVTTAAGRDAVEDAFIFAGDRARVAIADITGRMIGGEERLGDILVDRGLVGQEDVDAVLSSFRRLGEALVEERKVSPAAIDAALAEQRHARALHEEGQAGAERATIRVKSEKLDDLINIIGEIVTVQSHLEAAGRPIRDKALGAAIERMGKLAQDLRSTSMALRLVPFGLGFQRFARLARDLSLELGKEVDFSTEGGSTELDKSVLDKLTDPILHIVRNSIDHGLEGPEGRRAAGKPAAGRILLEAQHAGAWVRISVKDDGRGLDRDRILAKAVERGLADPQRPYSDEEVFAFIFEPGFSTADKVSAVSGRGVGMDVVRRSVKELGGTIALRNEPGAGLEVELNLPLTMAIMDGLLFRTAGASFVAPLSAVHHCVSTLDMGLPSGSKPGNVLYEEGELVPVIRSRELFALGAEVPGEEQLVYLTHGGRKLALVCDEIVGGHQTVIKSLGAVADYLEAMNGATILADGSIAFIIDLNRLFARATERG